MGGIFRRMLNYGNRNCIVASRDGKEVISLPLTAFVLLLLIPPITIWLMLVLMIIGLFFGLRYSLRGDHPTNEKVNEYIHKAEGRRRARQGELAGKGRGYVEVNNGFPAAACGASRPGKVLWGGKGDGGKDTHRRGTRKSWPALSNWNLSTRATAWRRLWTARDALEMAERGDYGLILLDVMLPGMSGMELLRRLRRTKQTPVIMVTARDAGDGQGDGSLDMGAGRLHHQAL